MDLTYSLFGSARKVDRCPVCDEEAIRDDRCENCLTKLIRYEDGTFDVDLSDYLER